MDQTTSHNNSSVVLQFEEDPVNLSLDAATKHVTPNDPDITNSARFSILLHKAAAELIGTFFLVFVGSILSVNAGGSRVDIGGRVSGALSGGMIVMLMIFSTGRISGAHLNPAVTLGFAMAGLFPWTQVIPYILSQIIGSLLASLTLQVLLHDVTSLSSAIYHPLHHDTASLVMECVATFLLMVINLKVACNLGRIGELGGIFMIGMTVALLGFIAGPLSGSLSMNPARSIGPAVVMLRLKSLHIFVLGPILGATFSGLVYGMICSPSNLDGKSSSTTSSQKCFNRLCTFPSERCKV